MNIPFYIAKRLAFNEKKSFSKFIIRVSTLAVALSISVMIIGSAITRGYQQVIQDKFYDCWGHIHLTTFLADPGNINSQEKFTYDSSMVQKIKSESNIAAIQAYTIQSTILKTKSDIEGILMKGVDLHEPSLNFKKYIIEGNNIQSNDLNAYSTEILISRSIASKLSIIVGDQVLLYFLIQEDEQPKVRKVKIVGIYKTGLEDYDNLFGLCDTRLINHINKRSEETIQGIEIYVKDTKKRLATERLLFNKYSEAPMQTYLIEKRFENVFSWLSMMKMNEQIILLIMFVIALVNMITALLILIMERTRMIGVLKSIGMSIMKIQSIFIYSCMSILLSGMLIGTVFGVSICLIQQKFGLLRLNESTYYIKTVPIYIDAILVLFINLGFLIICIALLFIPSFIIKNISPTKALKFN